MCACRYRSPVIPPTSFNGRPPRNNVPPAPIRAPAAGAARAALGLTLFAACAPNPPRPTSTLIITLDTTRADALSCQGAPAGVTPHLDALAARSVRYARARTVAPLTLPAHASLMTGLYPPRHGLRDNALLPLPAAAETLAEAARAAGLETAAFVAAAVLDPAWGLDQGFETYSSVPIGGARTGAVQDDIHMAERPATEVVSEAVAWLEECTGPFLLWVHFFDPHAPYEPPERFADRPNAYLGEVAAMDHAVGILLAALDRTGFADQTLVVVVADHGEDLGEHGEATHSVLVYDTTIRVPLLVLDPSGHGAGTVNRALVSIVDIFPTVIEALDLDRTAGDLDGVSLFRRAPPEGRGVYFESYAGWSSYGWAPLSGWASGAGQYIHGPGAEYFEQASQGRGLRQIYNRAAAHPQAVARARAAIEDVASRPALAREPITPTGTDPELLDAVRALGYVGLGDAAATAPHPLSDTGLPDPRAGLDELATFYRAANLANEGRRGEAITILAEMVDVRPAQTFAAEFLAQFLQAEGRSAEAVPVLRRALDAGVERPSLHHRLALCLEQIGELDLARAHLERAAALCPGDPRTEADLARLTGSAGRRK